MKVHDQDTGHVCIEERYVYTVSRKKRQTVLTLRFPLHQISWVSEWFEYAIFLHGLAEQRRP